MDCPACGTAMVGFAVPPGVREHAPGEHPAAAICPRCLELVDRPHDEIHTEPAFDRIDEAFPAGEAGAVTALAVGLLVASLARNRPAVAALFERATDLGVDPWLVLERLGDSATVKPDADLVRLRRQLEQLLG